SVYFLLPRPPISTLFPYTTLFRSEILWQVFSAPLGLKALYAVGLTTAGMTAFYMWRLMNMTFYGKSRVAPEVAAKIHESAPSMRSEEHTSELQSRGHLVCRLLLEK